MSPGEWPYSTAAELAFPVTAWVRPSFYISPAPHNKIVAFSSLLYFPGLSYSLFQSIFFALKQFWFMVLFFSLLNLIGSAFLQAATHQRCFGEAAVITDFVNNVIYIFFTAASAH